MHVVQGQIRLFLLRSPLLQNIVWILGICATSQGLFVHKHHQHKYQGNWFLLSPEPKEGLKNKPER